MSFGRFREGQQPHNLPALIGIALDWGAARIEVAHVQYHGWALANRDALLPTREQLDDATRIVEAARVAHRDRLVIDHVVPDAHAARPKACIGGWGSRFLAVSLAGRVLPCHAADSIASMVFPKVREVSLHDAWHHGEAFHRFRGTGWMPAPCQGCANAKTDRGGCRCLAFALTADAASTDPARAPCCRITECLRRRWPRRGTPPTATAPSTEAAALQGQERTGTRERQWLGAWRPQRVLPSSRLGDAA